MRNLLLIALIVSIVGSLFIPYTQAFNTSCSNGVLHKEQNISVSGTVIPITVDENCTYGCSDNGIECDSLASGRSDFVLIPLFTLLVAGLFAFLMVKQEGTWIEKKESTYNVNYYKLIFLGGMISFLFISMGMLVSYPTITISQVTSILSQGWLTLMTLLILILFVTGISIFVYLIKMAQKQVV